MNHLVIGGISFISPSIAEELFEQDHAVEMSGHPISFSASASRSVGSVFQTA